MPYTHVPITETYFNVLPYLLQFFKQFHSSKPSTSQFQGLIVSASSFIVLILLMEKLNLYRLSGLLTGLKTVPKLELFCL